MSVRRPHAVSGVHCPRPAPRCITRCIVRDDGDQSSVVAADLDLADPQSHSAQSGATQTLAWVLPFLARASAASLC